MDTLGTEAIRAFFTLQCCWLNNEEVYLEQGCLKCGSAATYLIYHTNPHIQKRLLKFIEKYRCHQARRDDLLDLDFLKKTMKTFCKFWRMKSIFMRVCIMTFHVISNLKMLTQSLNAPMPWHVKHFAVCQ